MAPHEASALIFVAVAPLILLAAGSCTPRAETRQPQFSGESLVRHRLGSSQFLFVDRFTGSAQALGKPHVHTGPAAVYVYVLEGELVITPAGVEQVKLRRGEIHREQDDTPMQVHNPSPTTGAIFLVIQVGPEPRTREVTPDAATAPIRSTTRY